jgi:hypothetical protein
LNKLVHGQVTSAVESFGEEELKRELRILPLVVRESTPLPAQSEIAMIAAFEPYRIVEFPQQRGRLKRNRNLSIEQSRFSDQI